MCGEPIPTYLAQSRLSCFFIDYLDLTVCWELQHLVFKIKKIFSKYQVRDGHISVGKQMRLRITLPTKLFFMLVIECCLDKGLIEICLVYVNWIELDYLI